jgi:hypothetical protein
MDKGTVILSLKVFQRSASGKGRTVVDFGGSDHVTDHFAGVVERHNASISAFVISVNPVFPMVFVASFVMKPGLTVAVYLSTYGKRGSTAIIIFNTFPKFSGRKFT